MLEGIVLNSKEEEELEEEEESSKQFEPSSSFV